MAKRIMIVDDEQETVMLLEAILQGQGYEVVTAANGLQALEKIKQSPADCVITDILMPEMDGFVFYKELRKDMGKIPFFVVTVRHKMEDTFLALGVDGFFVKPFNLDQLLSKISGSLGQAASVESPAAAPKPAEKAAPAAQPQVAPAAAAAAAAVMTKPIAAKKPGGKKFVVVSPSQFALDHISSYLESQRCQAEAVEAGAEAMDRAQVLNPDAIFLDAMLADVIAPEVVKRLRRQASLKGKPVIIFSYVEKDKSSPQILATLEGTKRGCMEAGATEYIGPFEKETFPGLVSKYLN